GDQELDEWARRIRRWTAPDAPHDVYVYFDNDAKVHAPTTRGVSPNAPGAVLTARRRPPAPAPAPARPAAARGAARPSRACRPPTRACRAAGARCAETGAHSRSGDAPISGCRRTRPRGRPPAARGARRRRTSP